MPTAPRACVIGHPVAHSRSPLLHGYWLRQLGIAGSYERVDVASVDLRAFVMGMAAAGFAGCNVTVPHKIAVAHCVDRMDAAASAAGAVNTVWFEDGEMVGSNTDVPGFLDNLDDRAPGWDKGGARALIVGAGGAARAAIFGLLQRGFAVDVANRSPAHAEALARLFGDKVRAFGLEALPVLLPEADLLVNATSLGMHGKPPFDISIDGLKPSAIVNDIVYVPLETGLLAAARARGNRVVDGLGMLLHQGKPGFCRWFGTMPEVTLELRALLEADIDAKTPGA